MSSQDNGALSFATAVDTSGFAEGVKRIEAQVADLGSSVEQQTAKIGEMINAVPKVNVDIVTNTKGIEQLDAAFAEIDRVRDLNEQGIRELNAAYDELGRKAAAAFDKGTKAGQKEADEMQFQQGVIKRLISARKQAISEANTQCDSLIKLEQKMKAEAAATEQTANKQVSLRTRLQELKMALVEMEAAGERGTQAYQDLQAETARLTDAWGDAQAQAQILANDQAGFQGVMSGLTGLSGGFTAASSAISLFAGENEDLQKAMLKVQQLMSITMGLQQVQQTLNKDSAFSLVTLNGLKEWWNKLLAVGTGEQAAETVAVGANTVAETANAAATGAAAAAKSGKAEASGAAMVAENTDTVATGANAVAAKVGTAANISLAGAFRMVSAAIRSIPVFGWIVAAIGALIGVISHFVHKANEMDEAVRKQQETLKKGREEYAKAALEITNYRKRIEGFNGTAEQEKKLISELNGKYGEQMGFCKTLADWKQTLINKGKSYCDALMQEAVAQEYLTKYVQAYTEAQEAAAVAKNRPGLFGGNVKKANRKLEEANDYKDKYYSEQGKADAIRQSNGLGGHTDDKDKSDKTDTFDPKKAARDRRKLIEDYTKEVKGFIKDANSQLTEAMISSAGEGLTQELNNISYSTFKKKEAWRQQLEQLAEIRKQSAKSLYLSQKGHTEDTWEQTAESKKSNSDYKNEILFDKDGKQTEAGRQYYAVMNSIIEQGEKSAQDIKRKYYDQWVQDYGTAEQKIEAIVLQYTKKMNEVAPGFRDAVIDEMEKAISSLESEDFKAKINWGSVFGDLDKQSLEVLEYNLDKIRQQFDKTKDSMTTEEIKDYQEAISNLENEIASRNPFAAFHKALTDISSSKQELVDALQSWKEAQDEETAAQEAYDAALAVEQELRSQFSTDEEARQSEEYITALDNLTSAKGNLNKATEKSIKAEQRTLSARNGVSNSYKAFAVQLRNVGGVVQDIGGKAKNLASVFSDDIADGVGKAIDFMGDILDAASGVISTIGDVGKNVAKGMEQTAAASGQAMQATATATATAISTVEKASVILAVISAALQVATAIANLFNNDKAKQKEIERLQERIDELQWELDNEETVRLQEKVGKAMDRLKAIYSATVDEVLRLHGVTQDYFLLYRNFYSEYVYKAEIMRKSIVSLADAYAQVGYTTDKALGQDKFKGTRKQLENLAEQQLLMQKQINAEQSKKKKDKDKIKDWQKQIEELGEEMAKVINEMLEDIIGSTAEDLAKDLGDAFIEAAKTGEDAMEAWGDKVNEIVADVTKRLLISEFLEKPMGEKFDKWKKKWFPNGEAVDIDVMRNSMTEFAADLNSVGAQFQQIWATLPDDIKDLFPSEDERTGSQKGIATASQESVDENNARLTTIQGHTYTLVQGLTELNQTSNAILDKVAGIERNTSEANERLAEMQVSVKRIGSAVEDMSIKGVKLK